MNFLKLHLLLVALFSLMIINSSNAQWEQVSNGMGNLTVLSFTASGNYLFAGTGAGNGVYISTNDGNNWTQTSLNIQSVRGLAANGNYIYAACNFPSGGQYTSTDYGTTWITYAPNYYFNYQSAGVNGNTAFIGGVYNNNLWRSTDNGTSWAMVSGISNPDYIYSILGTGSYVFAGAGAGIYLSTNDGVSFVKIVNNFSVLALSASDSTIWAGTYYNGVKKSSDYGISWTQTALDNKKVTSLAVIGNSVFAGTENSGVYFSSDNGSNWMQINNGLGSDTIYALCISNNYIFAGTKLAGVYRRLISEITESRNIAVEIPSEFSLSQNYPNPFNPSTTIKFSLPKSSFVKLTVYNITGSVVKTLVNEQKNAGSYSVDFDGSNLSSGVYFYKIQAEDFVQVKRMILIK